MSIILDFDGSLFNTFLPSPNGIGVKEAYEVAVSQCFGSKALSIYREKGLQNRGPSEVVRWLNGGQLSVELTKELVQIKLDCMMSEIGKIGKDGRIWPPIFPGVAEFLNRLNEVQVPWAILSSGHREFILKTFAVWGLLEPKVFSDDEASRLPEYPVKPNPVLLEMACQELGIPFEPNELVYIGDDLVKDGGLAGNAGAHFGWFLPKGAKVPKVELPAKTFIFEDWRILADLLKRNNGEPFESAHLASLFRK